MLDSGTMATNLGLLSQEVCGLQPGEIPDGQVLHSLSKHGKMDKKCIIPEKKNCQWYARFISENSLSSKKPKNPCQA